MRRLLLEGGVAGHLSHLYDNRQLTANRMLKILSMASQGELVGTEKTDGFNIYLGFRDGEARYARNKGDMQAGGRRMKDLVDREFAGGKQVKDVYLNAFGAFTDFINKLPPATQANIFGEDGSVFYNTEIQGPGANNVVTYDANVVSIHHGGHKRYNAETDTVEVVDAEANAKMLDKAIDSIEQDASGQSFSVKRTALLRLRKLTDDTDYRIVKAKIEKAGFTGDMTIEEYLAMKILPRVKSMMPHLNPAVHQMMVDYILEKRDEEGNKVKLNNIYKGFPLEQRRKIRKIVHKKEGIAGKLFKDSIWPLETAIHDFAVELLRGLESAYILDNNREVSRLRREVGSAVRAIQGYGGEGAEEARNVLAQQLQKIKHLDNIDSAVEGFVFTFDDQMYKFTGNFAPVNQILGLFKYGRGSVPAIARGSNKPQELEELEEVPQNGPERVVAILPGAFKPPHKGHFEMALHYAAVADVVKIYISRIAREGVDFETSKFVWNLYKEASNDPNASKIEVIGKPSENASPVGAAYEFVGNKLGDAMLAQPGDLVILAASSKADDKGVPDFMRFKNGGQYFGHGVLGGEEDPNTGIPIPTLKNHFKIKSNEPLSARDLRKAIRENDSEVVRRYLPEDVIRNDSMLSAFFDTLDIVDHGKNLTMEGLIALVEQVMPDDAFIELDVCFTCGMKHKGPCEQQEEELEETSGVGAVVGAVATGSHSKSKNKRAKREAKNINKDELIEKVLHYLVTRGAAK
tara:strand:+ start:2628 stop:4865 length:2238 start_codon:yes stop_codon:yes gene_type:complete